MNTQDVCTKVLCGVAAAICSTTLLFGPSAAHADTAADVATMSSIHAALERGKPNERRVSFVQTGTVTVEFELAKNGAVDAVALDHGSGSAILDAQAKALVRGAHFAPFAEHAFDDAATHRFVVSYVFDEPADGMVSSGPLRVVQR